MVGVLGLTGLAVMVLVNSALAALLTRFLRVRMNTSWGSLLYTVMLAPVALVVLIPVYSLVLGDVLQFGSNAELFAAAVGVPLALGVTFDYFWMPAPDEVELPRQAS